MVNKGTVLVVEDDAAIIDFLEMALEGEGYTVLAALGEEALQVAEAQHPALILLDIMMPQMDGIEVSQRLHDNPATAAIPIIVMSARSNLQRTAGLIQANDRLPKPFTLDQLYTKVARWTRAS